MNAVPRDSSGCSSAPPGPSPRGPLLAALLSLITSLPPLLGPAAALAQAAAPAAMPAQVPAARRETSLPLPAVYSDLYTLGPGDQLQLTFLDPSAKDVGGPVAILPDGTSTLALLGSVQLTGLTLGQASRWLTSLYARHLVRPQLILSLVVQRPVQVSVLGEVTRPGLYSFGGSGATAPGLTTPVSAIQTAGGVTVDADIRRVILRRLAGPNGAEKQTVIDLAQLLQVGNQRQNPILFDGDTLIVSRASQPLPNEVIQVGVTNLAPATINVTVVGEVKSPGTLSLPANTPLQQALAVAGGPTDWRANLQQIELVRLNRNGTSSHEFYNYRPSSDISKGFNPPLRDRDTVIVRRSYYGRTVDLVNQLIAPLANTFLFFNNLYYFNRR